MAEDATSLFDGAIPGSSLTGELGSEIHENPPIYTDPTEAYDYVVSGLMSDDGAERISIAAQLGVPAELIARSIVFSGWAQGYYTIDIMLLIFGPVFEVIMKLLDSAGIEYEKLAIRKSDDRLEKAFEELEKRSESEEPEVEPEPQEEEEEEVPSTGLMGRRD